MFAVFATVPMLAEAQSWREQVREKQQQDEDDWNAWILNQFGSLDASDCDYPDAGFDCQREFNDGGIEREVADSGETGSTSAAGAGTSASYSGFSIEREQQGRSNPEGGGGNR